MKFMPPKPELKYEGCFHVSHIEEKLAYQRQVNDWFEKEIKPLFENAITLYSAQWNNAVKGEWHEIKEEDDNVKAHLVNIQPLIEESESAEDLLREMVRWWEDEEDHHHPNVYDKAKAYLERKK